MGVAPDAATTVTARPFRFGIGPGGVRLRSAAQWRELARRAEGLGYATLSVGDHVGQYGPVAALAAAAAATSQLRVSALTLANDYRHPVVLAQEAATLDVVSDGRLELGLGAGWMRSDYEGLGIPMDAASTRIDRLEESVAVLKALLAGEELTFHGRHYTIDGVKIAPAPVQHPRPPLLIGGSGPRILTLAAAEADIVGLNVSLHGGALSEAGGETASREATERKVALVEQVAGPRARDIELEVYVHVTMVGDDRDAALRRAVNVLRLDAERALASPHALVGSVGEVVDALEERRGAFGMSYVSIDAGAMDEFAPVVARLAGT